MTSPWNNNFLVRDLGMSNSKGSRIIPYYLPKNRIVKHPNPFGKRLNTSGWISRVVIEVEPHLDLATFTSLKVS